MVPNSFDLLLGREIERMNLLGWARVFNVENQDLGFGEELEDEEMENEDTDE